MSGLRLCCALITMFLLTDCQSTSQGQKRQVDPYRVPRMRTRGIFQEVDDAMQYLEDLDRVYSVHVRPRFGKRSGALKQVRRSSFFKRFYIKLLIF